MGKYQGTAGCGHTYQAELYGPHSGRERRIEWMESPKGMCNACYATMKNREEEAAAKALSNAVEDEISRLVEVGVEKIRTEPEARAENLEKLRAYIADGTDPTRQEVCREVLKRVGGGSNDGDSFPLRTAIFGKRVGGGSNDGDSFPFGKRVGGGSNER